MPQEWSRVNLPGTTSQHGRSLRRRVDEECLERVRAYQSTEPYKKALRKRQV